MPQHKEPIKQRPKVEDESTGNPPEHHGPHQERDESLPGEGGTKAGLNRYSGIGKRGSGDRKHRRAPDPTLGTKQNLGKPEGKPESDQDD